MVVQLIASALLLDFFGCMMPLALVEDTKAFKVGVFLIWAALVADSVLMGLFYPRELAGVNPLLAAGLESICLICAPAWVRIELGPLWHPGRYCRGPRLHRLPRDRCGICLPALGYDLAYILLGSQAYGPVDHQAGGFRGVVPGRAARTSRRPSGGLLHRRGVCPMEGKRNRGEVTAELSEKVWARLCRENALVASEVWVDDARRIDFVAYRPHRPRDRSSNHATAAELESGTFTFVEVKSCMDDFTSGHGRTFEGDENWLVCPLELADSLASKGMLPKGAAVYSPDARGALRKRYDTSEFRQVRVAPAIELIWAMLRRKSSCETGAGFPV